MTRALQVTLAAALLAALAGGYVWWTSPERQIRRVLAGLADGMTHETPMQTLAAASAAAGLQGYFAVDVTIEPGRPLGAVRGRDAVLAAATRINAATPAFRLEFVDVRIALAPDGRSATVDCTAVATLRDRAGQETVDAREVMLSMTEQDGRWVVAQARAVDVLEPVTP